MYVAWLRDISSLNYKNHLTVNHHYTVMTQTVNMTPDKQRPSDKRNRKHVEAFKPWTWSNLQPESTWKSSHLTNMDIDFKKNNMWVLVAQRGESWSYSDTWATPGDLDNKNKVIY